MSRRKNLLLVAVMFLGAFPTLAQSKDAAGCKDDPLFPTRIPNYRIERCETKAFERYELFTLKPPKRAVEGELTFIQYAVDKREDDRSGLEVVRNYENALKKIGARIQASDPQRWVNGSVVIDGHEVWVQAEKGNGKIWLRIVRTRAMDQMIVADAASFANDLNLTGHASIYGIYFDTGKSEIKAESAGAIAEITKLLQADPGLKLFVVGHTDGVGSVQTNLKLSQDRANAVIQALIRAGIHASRLQAFGNGPFSPVASNANEDGRAKNRRVELVRQ